MKRVGIVICNYNKSEMVLKCIEAVLEQKYTDFDLYIVDNGSTDDSVLSIKNSYEGKLTLIENSENLGGSGGFNTGLRAAYNNGYDYLMCVDNDAFLDENAVGELVDFLDKHDECGMAASKIYHLEQPDTVQNFGQIVDFENFATIANHRGDTEDGSMPEFLYVDAVPACSLMVKRSTIDKIGFLPEENFLYWDDTEWGYKCNLAGMRVASVGSSKTLHSMGARAEDVNTFPMYYSWRNWINFFIKYTPEERLVDMALAFLSDIFEIQYEGFIKDEFMKAKTVMIAYDDAIHGRLGKADSSKYGPVDTNVSAKELPADYKHSEEYRQGLELFCYTQLPLFLDCADKIRNLAK